MTSLTITCPTGALQHYCREAYLALDAQKRAFLAHYPDAHYPCETSVFSAVTLLRGDARIPDDIAQRIDGRSWIILTPFGTYDFRRGGQIILWDFGLVMPCPSGAPILIPAFVRHSFVRIQQGETRYVLLQWAGAGIRRFFENGKTLDEDFAVKATREEYQLRESTRRLSHLTSLDNFPKATSLPTGDLEFPYRGENPPPQ
ncbi:hypothetical protein R3P38DRAFT_2526165 [Favolaschia claudopus]|uniref:Uncharacterized protein n=1 Tax=Favolaschia claudopus TaxID=2862362 RepID=A0AAW0BNI0_9AGAR